MTVISFNALSAFDVIRGTKDALDSSLFHGIAHNKLGTLREYVPGKVLPEALQLTRLGSSVPAVFSPASNLVVCERIWQECAVAGVESVEVQFRKLVEFKRRPALARGLAEHAWERLRDVPEYHESIGRYFELMSVPFRIFVSHFPDIAQTARKVKVTTKRESVESLSPQMFEKYPIIFTKSGTIVPCRLFEILDPWLDPHFYERGPVISI